MAFSVVSDSTNTDNRRQPIIRFVPWFEPEQFINVYESLYNPEITKKRWALDQISVWSTRCHPSLPAPIEATRGIVGAVVQDVLWSNGTTLCQEMEILGYYSYSLIRFVNLMIEIHQTGPKQNITNMANLLGIPTWIVDLRNQASHSHVPSLPCFRLGAMAALKYLEESYWSVEATKVKALVKIPDSYEDNRNLILQYLVLQFELIQSKFRSTVNFNMAELLKVRKEIKRQIRTNKHQFFKILAENGIFIQTEEDLKIILTDKELSDFQDVEVNENEEEDEVELKPPVLPAILQEFWTPLFRILLSFNEVPLFVEYLLNAPRHKDLVSQKLLVSWVIKIIRLSMVPSIESCNLSRVFKSASVKFNWNRMLMATITNPCKYTPFLLPMVFCNLNLDEEYMKHIMMLVAIVNGQTFEKDRLKLSNKSTRTIESVKQERNKGQKKKRKDLWTIDKDFEGEDFTNVPIGAVLNSDIEECEESTDDILGDLIDEFEYTEQFILCNVNDREDMETVTVEQNTVEEDEQILANRERFAYRGDVGSYN